MFSAPISVSSTNQDFAYRFTGGYQFNRYFGVEGGYVDLGSARANGQGTFYSVETCPPGYLCGIFPIGLASVYGSRAKLTVRGWLLAATASWPVSSKWSLFARLGGVYAHSTLETTSTPEVNNELPDFTVKQSSRKLSSTDWKPVYGVGVNFSLVDHWAVRLGWDRYAHLGDRNTTGRVNVNLLSLGVVYTL